MSDVMSWLSSKHPITRIIQEDCSCRSLDTQTQNKMHGSTIEHSYFRQIQYPCSSAENIPFITTYFLIFLVILFL